MVQFAGQKPADAVDKSLKDPCSMEAVGREVIH